jgi:hypothetical protein
MDRAAATLTCWPTIVRNRVRAPASPRLGSGRPCVAITLAKAGSIEASASMLS